MNLLLESLQGPRPSMSYHASAVPSSQPLHPSHHPRLVSRRQWQLRGGILKAAFIGVHEERRLSAGHGKRTKGIGLAVQAINIINRLGMDRRVRGSKSDGLHRAQRDLSVTSAEKIRSSISGAASIGLSLSKFIVAARRPSCR